MASKTHPHKTQPVLALLLAWIVPGLGHFYIGRRARGVIIMLVIAATFWVGVAVGGVMTVDAKYERWWFYAQALTGIHGIVGWYRQNLVYEQIQQFDPPGRLENVRGEQVHWQQAWVDRMLAGRDPNFPLDEPLALVSPADTVARAYSGVAGLLNLMCIFDAGILSLMGVYGEPARKKGDERGEREGKEEQA